ncbi:hypothetical protein DRO26_03710 [Candidatus Bathyarchaeota archaeon]|jgi:DNA-directed RNA polymerase subunit RPC12/RpoP|nr:MAG: hypothetical protein DRO26_03710 [Candidatus Bathyarchaeota archaeon]
MFIKNFFEVLSKIRRSGKERLVCPRCRSSKVYPSSWMNGWLTPPQYVCEKCGYKGPILMKLEEE